MSVSLGVGGLDLHLAPVEQPDRVVAGQEQLRQGAWPPPRRRRFAAPPGRRAAAWRGPARRSGSAVGRRRRTAAGGRPRPPAACGTWPATTPTPTRRI